MFAAKWPLLDPYLQQAILDHAKEKGARSAANTYAAETGIGANYLVKLLNKKMGIKPVPRGDKKEKGKWKPEKKLTKEEEEFIGKLKKGEVNLDDAGRLVAAMVFEKMLKNPDDVKFIDFYRTEFLKIKDKEVNDKREASMELLNRLFSGQPLPKVCPHCGKQIFTNEKRLAVEAEVLSETD